VHAIETPANWRSNNWALDATALEVGAGRESRTRPNSIELSIVIAGLSISARHHR
jgi:hypothetical protein